VAGRAGLPPTIDGELKGAKRVAKNGRILVADDEEDFLKFAASLLKKEGYECDCAVDGSEAVEMLRRHRYDAVISDIRMPDNPDLRLAREVQKLEDDVPVIIVTGYPSMDTAVRAVELPVVAYVEKPVEFSELLLKLKSAILLKHGRRAVAEAKDCRRGDCGQLNKLLEVLAETADELKSTKSAFKSKRLGRLRTRLELVVKQLLSEDN
jgi:DNA-binding NtrC family response regulator